MTEHHTLKLYISGDSRVSADPSCDLKLKLETGNWKLETKAGGSRESFMFLTHNRAAWHVRSGIRNKEWPTLNRGGGGSVDLLSYNGVEKASNSTL